MAFGTRCDPMMSKAAELEEAWRDALCRKDEVAIRALLHPDYELVGMRPTGPISVGVEKWMTALKSMDIATVSARVIDAIELPHTIVATVDACWKLRYRGQLIDERVLLTDVWVRDDDSPWRVVRRHSSLVPKGVEVG